MAACIGTCRAVTVGVVVLHVYVLLLQAYLSRMLITWSDEDGLCTLTGLFCSNILAGMAPTGAA